MGRFNTLPKEIILETLTGLPTESVICCKLVCKLWRDLVHDSSFSKMHLNHLNSVDDDYGKLSFIIMSRNQEMIKLYYIEYDDDTLFSKKTRMNLIPPFGKYSFVGSYNGLICFNKWCTFYDYSYRGPACICNPITREYIMLPNIQGYDPWTGFGYIPSTNEYKVVRISDDGVIQVYTLGSGNGWRNVGEMDLVKPPFSGVVANGALHWLNHHQGTLFAFDLKDEKFSELTPPSCLTPNAHPDYACRLRVLGDFLSVIYYRDHDSCVDIWLSKKNEDNNELSWSKEFTIESCMPLYFEFMKSGKILCYGSGNIYNYDPKASSARPKIDVSFGKCTISQAIRHMNTLVSLKVLGEKNAKKMDSGRRASSS
ncbi:F-box protein At3g07870-like [Papaver somniferum]|uniref:F-box protein At3g07870-like n=1 Tax=Papaver somniferum TaxID=3469 RepID=UPI000E6F477D|nr:F-box protein At3g07870-like [Papaver somniferum]